MAAVRTITTADYIEAGLMWRMPRPALPLAPRGWNVRSIGVTAGGDSLEVSWDTPEGVVDRTYGPADEFKVRF